MAKKTPAKKPVASAGIGILIPLLLVLAVIPLIVQLKIVQLPSNIRPFWTNNYAADFFSYYKSKALILVAVYMVGSGLYYYANSKEKLFQKSFYNYLIPAGMFGVFVILSALFSPLKSIAFWGAPERCEGMIIWLMYLIVFVYAIWAFLNKPDYRVIVYPLAVLIGITTFLGAFQFWGHDLFYTKAGQSLIVPAAYRSQGELQMLFERGKIYGTMYHYNYMGSFTAMMIPLFLVLTLFTKNMRSRILFGGITLCSLFLLLGSTSRAGIIGVGLAAIFFIVLFAGKLRQHYKATAASVAALIVFVFFVNIITGGLALARIPSLMRDAGALFSNSDVDYHTQIPLQHIDLQDKQVTLSFKDGDLTITKNLNNQPVIQSASGKYFTAPGENAEFTMDDHKFNLQYINIGENRTPFLGIYLGNNMDMILGLFDDSFSFVDSRVNRITYTEAPSIGFQGKERLGSARGYIWSRSLPLVVKAPVFGYGPDTFFAVFPQGDFLAKYYSYGTSQMLVDKAHNLYLQIAIGEGVPALIAFIVLFVMYIANSFRLYAFRKEYTEQQAFGAGITLAIIGYLGAGFFNDSIVSVAPIFWVLLGVGIAVNHLNIPSAE